MGEGAKRVRAGESGSFAFLVGAALVLGVVEKERLEFGLCSLLLFPRACRDDNLALFPLYVVERKLPVDFAPRNWQFEQIHLSEIGKAARTGAAGIIEPVDVKISELYTNPFQIRKTGSRRFEPISEEKCRLLDLSSPSLRCCRDSRFVSFYTAWFSSHWDIVSTILTFYEEPHHFWRHPEDERRRRGRPLRLVHHFQTSNAWTLD